MLYDQRLPIRLHFGDQAHNQFRPPLSTGVLQNRAQALGATPLSWFVKVYPYELETE